MDPGPLIESQHCIFYNAPVKFSPLILHLLSKLPLGPVSLPVIYLSTVQEMPHGATDKPPLGGTDGTPRHNVTTWLQQSPGSQLHKPLCVHQAHQ